MESQQPNQSDDHQEVRLKLTEEQREQIKRATGKLITELKLEAVEERANPIYSYDHD
jgi:hypothetical protein